MKRLHKFLVSKTFIIKDDEGFKEMPVLVSAAAVQLTLGLKLYLLVSILLINDPGQANTFQQPVVQLQRCRSCFCDESCINRSVFH